METCLHGVAETLLLRGHEKIPGILAPFSNDLHLHGNGNTHRVAKICAVDRGYDIPDLRDTGMCLREDETS